MSRLMLLDAALPTLPLLDSDSPKEYDDKTKSLMVASVLQACEIAY
jgi:hypothetical protein